jgi:PLD-like domain
MIDVCKERRLFRGALLAKTAALTALTVAITVAVAATPAEADTPTDSAVFNNPLDAVGKYAIENQVVGLINGAPASSTIRLSTYIFASATYRDALINAYNRGVHVQIVADSYNAPDTATTFHQVQAVLGSDKSQPSFAMTCAADKGCIGDTGIDHDKFFLFSSTGGASKVVVQTSANMVSHDDGTGNSGINAWNNAVTLVDEPAIYDAYVTRFTAMRDQVTSTPYSSTAGNDAKAYFFPRSSGSTILDILNNVNCAGKNTSGGYGTSHLTSIHVAMYEFTDASIAQKLWDLDNAGCVVHVVRTNVGTADDDAIAVLNNCDAHNGVTIDSIHSRVKDLHGIAGLNLAGTVRIEPGSSTTGRVGGGCDSSRVPPHARRRRGRC